jgi:ATP-dependent Clp protease ATP-binding subunit ClpA
MLKDLQDAMAENHLNLICDDSLFDYLVTKSFSAAYGARNLRRLLQKELEDAIAGLIVERHAENISQLKAFSDSKTISLAAL